MAGLDLNVVVTGTEKLDELIKKLKTTGTASESMIKSFNDVSTIFKDVGNEVTSLVARAATLEKENKKLTTSATTAAAAQDKLKISLASVSAAAMGSLADINKMSSALAKQTLELSTVSKQTALLVTSQHSLANSSKGLAAVTYERLAAYQAEKAALSQLNSLVATHTGLMGTRKNLETGVTAAMQRRIASEQALVAVQKQLTGLSTHAIQSMQKKIIATSALTDAQKKLALAELGLAANQGKLVDSSGKLIASQTKVIAGSEKATASMNKQKLSATNLGSAIRGVSGAMGKLWLTYGNLGAMIAGFAAASAAVGAFKEALEVDYFVRYSAAVGDTSQTVEDLSDALLSIRGVAHGPKELAEGLRELSKAGYDLDDAISGGALVALSKFSVVAEMDFSKAIQLAVTQMSAFKRDGMVLTDVLNYMAKAALSAPITFEDLAQTLKNTTELSTVAKVKFTDLMTAVVLLGEAGIKGSRAGTALRTSILKMLDPSAKITKALKAAGFELTAFTDSGGKVKDLQGMFEGLADVMKNLDVESQAWLQKNLLGLRALKAGANLANSYGEIWDESLGRMTTAWERANEQILKSVEGAGFLNEAFKEIAQSGKIASAIFASAFKSEAISQMSGIMESLGPTIYKLIPYADDLAAALITVAQVVSVGLLGAFAASVPAIVAWINKINLALIATGGVFAWLSAAVVGAFAGWKIGTWLQEEFEWAAEAGVDMVNVLTRTFLELEYAAKAVWLAISSAAGVAFDSVLEAWANALDLIIDSIEQLATVSIEMPEWAGGKTIGFTIGEDKIAALKTYTQGLRNVSTAKEDLIVSAKKLDAERTAGLATQKEIIQSLYDDVAARFKGKDATTELAQATLKWAGDLETGTASLTQGTDALKEQAKALDELEKLFAKWEADISTQAMDAQGKVMAEAIQGYEEMVEILGRAGLKEEEYNKVLAEGTEIRRARTQRDLDAIDAKEELARATAAAALALKVEEKAYANQAATLKGMAKLHAEYGRAMVKFKQDADYVKLLEDNGDATDRSREALAQFSEVTKEAVYSTKNLAQALREGTSFTDGFKAGLMEIAEEMKTLGEYGADLAHTLRDATADSFSTILKSSVYGLSEAKSEIENTLNDTLDAATETYNLALVELEASYAAGAIATEEYEANKLSILNEFNTQKMDAQTQYGEDIREAEDQLGTDLKDIWKGVLDSILDMGANWAADMVLTMGTNLVSELLSGDVWGKIGDFFAGLGGSISSLFEGDFSGAWDGVKSALGLGGGEGAMDVNVVSSVCCSEMAASLEDIVSGVDGLDSTMVETMGPAAKYLTQGLASAISTGVGTAASWAAGLYAAEMGVNEGTQLALIEGTYGPASVDWGSAIGTAVAAVGVAAGGYGIYSGINSIAEGDYGTGAIQTGLGAASMYKGLVGLEVVESGTATAVYDSMVAYFGGAGAEVVSTAGVVGGGAADVAGLAAAEAGMSSGAAGSSGAAAAGAAAFTPALMAAGAALFAVVGKLTPSVSMYTDELVSASGRTLELIDFAWTEAEAKANFNDPAWVDAQLDTVAAYGTNVLSQDSYVEDMGYIHTSMSNTIAGAFEARVTDTQAISAETEYGGEQAAAIEQISDSLFTKLRDAYTALEIDATQYGDKLAQIALQMAGSTESFDTYVDAIAGHDVALADSSAMMQLASQAAGGSSAAFQNLISALITQGLTTQQATEAASTMAAVLYDQGAATSMATSAANDMSNAIQEFSDTDLNLEATAKLNVEVEGDADVTGSVGGGFSVSSGSSGGYSDSGGSSWSTGENALGAIYDYHARGGVMTQPTVFHVGGEAGTEGIIPLRSPDQMNIIEDKVNSLIEYLANKPEQPVVVNVKGDEKGLKRFIEVETDQHVVARNKRGLTTERVSY